MTADHPVRRLLARVCSAQTMARVVDPTLADMRAERGRAAWRGYAALARALMLHVVLALPGAAQRLWRADERAVPRALVICAVTTLVLCAPLVAFPAKSAARISWRAVILLSTQPLALAVPASILIAIPVAFGRSALSRWSVARGLMVSALCAATTLFLVTRVIPDANQAFRVETLKRLHVSVPARQVSMPRGPVEMTMAALRAEIDAAHVTGDPARARRLEYTYQLRLVISVMALPLGMLALALRATPLGSRRPWAAAAAGVGCYLLVLFPLQRAAQHAVAHSMLPTALLVWCPLSIIASLALIIARAYARLGQPSPEHAR
jgi:hypothetical protein